MPPDPILALLCVVGLGLYGVIGGGVAALTAKAFKYRRGHDAAGYAYAGVLWPFWSAVVVAGAVIAGPVWIGSKVAKYVHGELPALKEWF